MPYTQLFDPDTPTGASKDLFDPGDSSDPLFDIVKRYTVDILEKKTLFDSTNDLFDPVKFDTIPGGILEVSDTVTRLISTYRTLSESISISDSVSRRLGLYRTISESTISVGAGLVERLLIAYRTITGVSVTTSDSAATISPTSNRYIYDLGSVFDTAYFSSPPFDIDVKSYTITDSVSRLYGSFRTITDTGISISDSISRIVGAVRSLSESVSISDSVSRLLSTFRSISDTSISVSDSISRILGSFRSISESTTVSDSISRLSTTFRTMSESVSISDSVGRLMSSFRSIAESTISISDAVSRSRDVARVITEAAITISDSVLAPLVKPALVIRNTVYVLRTSRITTYIGRIIRNTVYG